MKISEVDWKKVGEDLFQIAYPERRFGDMGWPRIPMWLPKWLFEKNVKEYVEKLQASLEPPKTLGERASFWWALKRVASGTNVVDLIFAVEHVITNRNEECELYMVKLHHDHRPWKRAGFEEDRDIPKDEPDPWIPKDRSEVGYAWLIEKFIL